MAAEAEPRSQPAPITEEAPQKEEETPFSDPDLDLDELLHQNILQAQDESSVTLLGS